MQNHPASMGGGNKNFQIAKTCRRIKNNQNTKVKIMLKNNDIKLRPLELEDSDILRKWRFFEDNYDYFYEYTPNSSYSNKSWVQNCLNKTNEINFIITENDSNIDIGMISLLDIDLRNKKCEMGRVLIANDSSRGKGLGTQAIKLILEYAFNHLNLNKVYCEVFVDNLRALNSYKKIGFVQDGLFKNHIYKNGEYKDIAHLSIEKENFKTEN